MDLPDSESWLEATIPVSIPYGAIRWIYAHCELEHKDARWVSIPYGAIRWIYRVQPENLYYFHNVSIPYGAIRWIYLVQEEGNEPYWARFNPLRGNPVDLR